MQLYDRKAEIRVATLKLIYPGLDFEFSVEKSTGTSPNKASVKIWNLAPNHRLFLSTLNTVPTEIKAGYAQGMSTLFLGNLRTVKTEQDGPDIVTTVAAGDGEQAYRDSRVNLTIPKGTSTEDVAKMLAGAMKLGLGNIPDAFKQLQLINGGKKIPCATVLRGNAARELSALMKSHKATWSIQNGQIRVHQRGKPAVQTAVKLTESTGLIGSPSMDAKGLCKAKCLIQPDLDPGCKFVLESRHLQGQFIVLSAKYSGKTADKDWYIELEGKRY